MTKPLKEILNRHGHKSSRYLTEKAFVEVAIDVQRVIVLDSIDVMHDPDA